VRSAAVGVKAVLQSAHRAIEEVDMSTRRLIIMAVVFAVVLVVALALSQRENEGPVTTPTASPTTAAPVASPSGVPSGSPSATPSPSPSALTASTFTSTGELAAGWYWLRGATTDGNGTWQFTNVRSDGDFRFEIEVLATDADGARGEPARFFFAWAAGVPASTADWAGRLPVDVPNVSPSDDPLGYTCRGTVSVPRSTVGGTTVLTVMISRNDVRGELEPTDVPVAVNATSVKLIVQ
jgi:hypothetical protein